MADATLKTTSAQNWECPICLDTFTEPKRLSCSHSFCKACLAQLLKCQSEVRGKLPCPVCKHVTDVPGSDVDQLQSNDTLKELLQKVTHEQNKCTNCKKEEKPDAVAYCQVCGKYLCRDCYDVHRKWGDFSMHKVIMKKDFAAGQISTTRRQLCDKHNDEENLRNYFCNDCRMYVCFKCGVREHESESHTVVKAKEYEEAQSRGTEELVSEADEKISSITECIASVREQEGELQNVFRNLEYTVTEAYEDAVKHLTQRRDSIMTHLKESFAVLRRELQGTEETCQQQIKFVNAVKGLVLKGIKVPPMETDAIAAHDTLCEELAALIEKEGPDLAGPRNTVTSGKNITFQKNEGAGHPVLGSIRKVGLKIKLVVELSEKDSMNCVLPVPGGILGVGCKNGGIEVYSWDGTRQERILRGEGICEAAFLSDGRCVVRNNDNTISVFQGQKRQGVRFVTLSSEEGGIGGLTTDGEDNIYVSYRTARKIQKFAPEGGTPNAEVKCDDYVPQQIFALKSGKDFVVRSHNNSVWVIDESGAKKHEVSKDSGVLAHPAVLHDDSIMVAWVKHDDGTVSIDQYNSELEYVTSLVSDFKIQRDADGRRWYYLREFAPNEVAFCTPDILYFFHKEVTII